MNRLELLKNELWGLFDRMDKDTTGKGIKTGLVAAQAIVAKHTDGYVLVPVETELNAFIEQTHRLLERSKACAVNPMNASKADFYTGQSHGIEMVLDALKDVISDTAMNHGWISVNDRLPLEYAQIDILINAQRRIVDSTFLDGKFYVFPPFSKEDWTEVKNNVSHWMPIPPAPEQPK